MKEIKGADFGGLGSGPGSEGSKGAKGSKGGGRRPSKQRGASMKNVQPPLRTRKKPSRQLLPVDWYLLALLSLTVLPRSFAARMTVGGGEVIP